MGAFLVWTTPNGESKSLLFDVVTEEGQTLSASSTDHPVEDGPDITDHIQKEVDRVSLTVFVTNTPIVDIHGRGGVVAPLKLDPPPNEFNAVAETVQAALSGNVRRMLTDFCRSAGLEWSVQDGKVQILDAGRTLSDKAIELSPKTGLIESPSVDFKVSSKTERGGAIVKAKALLIPELTPGKLVVFRSRSMSGGYRIEEVTYRGDSFGRDWYAELVCRSL